MHAVANWFWRLIPANPLVLRIVQTASKRTPHLWLRSVFLGVMILMLVFSLLAAGAFSTTGDPGQLAAAGSQLFATIAYGQLLLLGLLAPIFLGSALSSERSGRTLDVLLTTPLSNLQIVLGSLLGRLFFLLALLFSSFPLMAIVRLLGGVRGESITTAYLVAALMLYFLGAVAVTLSSWRVGGRGGVLFFVIGVGGYLLLIYGIDFWLLRSFDPMYATWLTPLHPMLVLTTSVSPSTYQTPTMAELTDLPWLLAWYRAHPLAVFTILTAGLGSLMLMASTITMRSSINQRLRRARVSKARASSKVWANPVAWHECRRLGRGFLATITRYLVPAVAIILTILLLMMHAGDQLTNTLGGSGLRLQSHIYLQRIVLLLVILQMAIGMLIGLFYATSTVAREREDGTLDILLTTPLGARRYLWGKVRGLLSGLLPIAAGAILTLTIPALFAWIGTRAGWTSATYSHIPVIGTGNSAPIDVPVVLPEAPIWLALTYLPMLAAVIAMGLDRSISAKSVLSALVPALIVALIITAVSGWIGLAAATSGEPIGLVINSINPFTQVIALVAPWEVSSAFGNYPMTGRVALGIGSVICALIYGVFLYGRISITVKGFDHAIRKRAGVQS